MCWWSSDSNIRNTACRDGMRMLETDHQGVRRRKRRALRHAPHPSRKTLWIGTLSVKAASPLIHSAPTGERVPALRVERRGAWPSTALVRRDSVWERLCVERLCAKRLRQKLNAPNATFSSPRVVRGSLFPGRSPSRSRKACHKRPRGFHPCSWPRPWHLPLP
jgi:hypothetical protein